MSDVDRHGELEDLVAPWVLGGLDDAEEQSLRTHVEGCASCREAADRLRAVVGVLPLSVDEVAPPSRLRDRVLGSAASATPVKARTSPRHAGFRAAGPVRRLRVAPGLARRMPAYALAAVALVSLLAGVLAGQIAFRGPAGGTTTSQVARFTMTGHGQMASAQATVVDLRSDGVALLDFRGLPALAPGRVYEVWLIPAKGDPVPAATFVPDSDGAKVVLVNRSLSGYAVMAVTQEAGPDGAAAPTQQPQLYGDVA